MSLLESVIGGVVGQVLGGRGGAQGGAMSPLVKALLMLLLAKGASGGFSDIFGGGHRREPDPEAGRSGGGGPDGRDPGRHPGDAAGRGPGHGDTGGDIGGFDQWGGRRDTGPAPRADPSLPGEGFDDLSGMLDGPGDSSAHGPGPGMPRGRDPEETPDLGGLDGLIEGFRKGGLGDVIGSWIGHGPNRAIEPHQLARALGDDTVATLERETGMGRDALLGQLAEVLPRVVDGLTPEKRFSAQV